MSTFKAVCRAAPRPPSCNLLPRQSVRHESTTRRHKKLNTLPEAPSFSPSSSATTILFNPPSSAPNVYHTPLKFLPKTDRRRQLYSAATSAQTASAIRTQTPFVAQTGTALSASSFLPPKSSSKLPPPVRQPYQKKYHLTETEIAEIKKLRSEDPETWTRVRLAEKFGCSQFFVSLICKVPEKAAKVEAEHAKAREKWGTKRREARRDRVRRKESWGRDA